MTQGQFSGGRNRVVRHFFADPPLVRALRRHLLPELLQQSAERRRLRVWSAGCSTGEEPYTVAMLIRELLPTDSGWDVEVLATDASDDALSVAAEARYAERSVVMTDPLDLSRWLTIDTVGGGYVVRDEVRQLVTPRRHDLATDPVPAEAAKSDLILCRDLSSCVDEPVDPRLIEQLCQSLRPGGYLLLAPPALLWRLADSFGLIPLGGGLVYRRPAPGEERRRVLADRRTEDELSPLRTDRRRSEPGGRRRQESPTDRPDSAEPADGKRAQT